MVLVEGGQVQTLHLCPWFVVELFDKKRVVVFVLVSCLCCESNCLAVVLLGWVSGWCFLCFTKIACEHVPDPETAQFVIRTLPSCTHTHTHSFKHVASGLNSGRQREIKQ